MTILDIKGVGGKCIWYYTLKEKITVANSEKLNIIIEEILDIKWKGGLRIEIHN
ncbi:hypothetical protein [Clostridium beijerinckii]|uniref:hypothetical protein n=1 Tax=Clostridium beijerinckii TaxID=1520 RepID=UPI0022E658B6|nr:hypothetical protein [Clostridium beijerinckii]